MSDTSLESIMKCSKEAIARAYMCRAYVTVPIGECPDPYWGMKSPAGGGRGVGGYTFSAILSLLAGTVHFPS